MQIKKALTERNLPRGMLVLLPVMLSACVGMPQYQSATEGNRQGGGLADVINYHIDPLLNEQALDCLVVMPLAISDSASANITFSGFTQQDGGETDSTKIQDEDIYDLLIDANDKREMLRGMLYAFSSPHRARDIELSEVDRILQELGPDVTQDVVGEALSCDWILEGEITRFSANNYGIYSAINIAADLKIVRASDGKVVWHGNHDASSKEGSVPLTPLELAFGAVKATMNISPEQIERTASDLARRLVRTMPLDSQNEFVIAEERQHLLRVISQGLNMREGPGTSYPISDVLNNNEQVTLIEKDTREPWIRVRTEEGREGYVSGWYLN